MIKYQIENLDNLDNPIGQWAANVIREQQAEIERLREALSAIVAVYEGKSCAAKVIAQRALRSTNPEPRPVVNEGEG